MPRKLTSFLAAAALLLSACSKNYYGQFEDKDTTAGEEERIQGLLDDRDYDDARLAAERLLAERDGNEVRLMLVSARLGQIGAALWDQISDYIDYRDELDSEELRDIVGDGKPAEQFFKLAVFLQIVGLITNEPHEAQRKWISLTDSMDLLVHAPDPDDPRMHNATCYLAALNVVPTVYAGLTSASHLLDSSSKVIERFVTTGNACDEVDALNDSLAEVFKMETIMGQVLAVAETCEVLAKYKKAQDGIEKVSRAEKILSTLVTNADKGCDGPVPFLPVDPTITPACLVEKLTGDPQAVAGDGVVRACEFITNCMGESFGCFDAESLFAEGE